MKIYIYLLLSSNNDINTQPIRFGYKMMLLINNKKFSNKNGPDSTVNLAANGLKLMQEREVGSEKYFRTSKRLVFTSEIIDG